MPPKFRAWNPSDKVMVYDGFYINQATGKCHYVEGVGSFVAEITQEAYVILNDCGEEEPILMQSTSITDKNNKEIFEEDRVRVNWLAELGITEFDCTAIGTVKYLKELGGYYIVFDRAYIRNMGGDMGEEMSYEVKEIGLIQPDEDMSISFECFGNIYENESFLQ